MSPTAQNAFFDHLQFGVRPYVSYALISFFQGIQLMSRACGKRHFRYVRQGSLLKQQYRSSTSSNHSWFKYFCSFHSKNELLVIAVYPLVGGVSGKPSKNLASETLNGTKAVMLFTPFGRRFQSLFVL